MSFRILAGLFCALKRILKTFKHIQNVQKDPHLDLSALQNIFKLYSLTYFFKTLFCYMENLGATKIESHLRTQIKTHKVN